MADPAYIVDGVLTDGEAWVAISHAALSLPAATVTWTSTADGQVGDFSQYMDLVILSYCHSDNAASVVTYLSANFNNSSGNRHNIQWMFGTGTASYASRSVDSSTVVPIGLCGTDAAGATMFAASVTYLSDINGGKFKNGVTLSCGDTNGNGEILINTITWQSQAAITEIDLTTATDDFEAGSRFDLFGILPRMVNA